MVRPTDQEVIAIEKTACHSQVPRGGSTARGPQGEAAGSVRRGAGECGQKSSLQCLWDGTGEAGRCRTKYIEWGKHYVRSEKTSFLGWAWLLSKCVPSRITAHLLGCGVPNHTRKELD